MTRILVVDDDLSMREFLELMLTREGYEVTLASGGQQALDRAAEIEFDLVITDIRMKEVDGIAVLKNVRTIQPDTVVILISAFATVETAVAAMKEGAYDFIPKPFQIEELKAVVRSALAHRTPEAERKVLEEKVKEGCHFGSLVGLSPEMLKVYDLVKRAAQTPTNILISGESGTGKELAARAIHENSPRAEERFVAINCGGMPEQLIESELFGYRKGAFTGATMDKPGLFETAHKGTIFLDEIAELSLPMQVKLLRVVQDKTYRAVGGTEEKVVDVRFIAATNKDLEAEVIAGKFREDLYYRLNVINIHLPSLRERKSDIPLLAQYFLEKYSRTLNKDVLKISAYALDILANYDFPGNVRELENIIERSVALEQSCIILPESLTLASFKQQRRISYGNENSVSSSKPGKEPDFSYGLKQGPSEGLEQIITHLEKSLLAKALQESKWVKKDAAKLLGITPWRLRNLLNKIQLEGLSQTQLDEIINHNKSITAMPDGISVQWKPEGLNLDEVVSGYEKHLVEQALKQASGSQTKAAQILGITLRSLQRRLSKLQLPKFI